MYCTRIRVLGVARMPLVPIAILSGYGIPWQRAATPAVCATLIDASYLNVPTVKKSMALDSRENSIHPVGTVEPPLRRLQAKERNSQIAIHCSSLCETLLHLFIYVNILPLD